MEKSNIHGLLKEEAIQQIEKSDLEHRLYHLSITAVDIATASFAILLMSYNPLFDLLTKTMMWIAIFFFLKSLIHVYFLVRREKRFPISKSRKSLLIALGLHYILCIFAYGLTFLVNQYEIRNGEPYLNCHLFLAIFLGLSVFTPYISILYSELTKTMQDRLRTYAKRTKSCIQKDINQTVD
jgi:ABC-type Fe3+-siderophore transport system permease subunit